MSHGKTMIESSHYILYFFFVLHSVWEPAMVSVASVEEFFSNVIENIVGDGRDAWSSGESNSFE